MWVLQVAILFDVISVERLMCFFRAIGLPARRQAPASHAITTSLFPSPLCCHHQKKQLIKRSAYSSQQVIHFGAVQGTATRTTTTIIVSFSSTNNSIISSIMKFATAVALLSLLTTSSTAFVSRKNTPTSFLRPASLSPLTIVGSTLAPDTPDTRLHGDDTENNGALSMQIDELAEVLGGRGRAQIVWDCYSIVSSKN